MKRRSFTSAALGALIVPGVGVHADTGNPSPAFAAAHAAASSGSAVTQLPYFGMHFHRVLSAPGARTHTVWPNAAIGSLRLWDSGVRWADVAPRRDRWDFDKLDAYVELAEAHGASMVYTLGSTPRWASARPDEAGPYGPGCAAEPAVMADWNEYVQRVVTRYRGRIATYEVWNEPYFTDFARDRGQPTFFSGNVAQMLEMTRSVRQAIDRSDPAAKLATPGFVNGSHRLDLFLTRGGAGLVDLIAYHFYAADAQQFFDQVDEVRALMARRKVGHLQLWNTECGVERATAKAGAASASSASDVAADALAADHVAQFLILGAATRLDRFYYYAWDNYLSGMVDRTGAANARAPAYERAQQWLLGARVGAPARLPNGGFRVEAVRGQQRKILAWSDAGDPTESALGAGQRIERIEPLRDASASTTDDALSSMPVCISPGNGRSMRS